MKERTREKGHNSVSMEGKSHPNGSTTSSSSGSSAVKSKVKSSITKPTLTYFNTSGRADLLRLILEVAGVAYDYEALNVPFYPSTGKDWFDYKQENADHLLFGQVPRYQDGSVDLVQSNAIARYLAQKYGLAGKDIRLAPITTIHLIPALY